MTPKIVAGWVYGKDAIGFWHYDLDLLIAQPPPFAEIPGVALAVSNRSDPLALFRSIMCWWSINHNNLPQGSGDALFNFLSTWEGLK